MLQHLPVELLRAIVACLSTDGDVSNLARTNCRFHLVINPILYCYKPRALKWAAENGRVSTAQLVIDGCPELNMDEAASDNGESILSLAAKNGHAHMVQWLLRKGIMDVNHRDEVFGRTALLHAVGEDQIDVAKVLLATPGIDVNLRGNTFLSTPLSLAAECGHEELAKLLIASPHIAVDARDGSGFTPLTCAAASGAVNIVRLLLDSGRLTNGSDQASYIKPAIWWAADAGYQVGKQERLEILKLLLREPDVGAAYRDQDGKTLLIWVAMKGELDIVKLLLDSGKFFVNVVDNDGRTAFSRAAERSLQVMQCLHQTGKVDINEPKTEPGCSPIWHAVRANYRWSLDWLLLQDEIDASTRDSSGITLLEYAVRNDLPIMVEALLGSPKVDTTVKSKHGESLLHQAAIRGNDKMVKQLVDSDRVDVNVGDKRGRTAMSWAAEMGFNAVMVALLTSGRADVRKANVKGVTPLKLAKCNKNTVCVQLLWNSGQLDDMLEKGGSSQVQPPVDHKAQEYIRNYMTETRLGWSPKGVVEPLLGSN